MQKEKTKENFDKMAASYDKLWEKLAPINDSLHLLMGSILANLPQQAKILCVGAGTGAEIIYLAKRFPLWTFTAVDPSGPMLEVCRKRLLELDIESRCKFHIGYLDSLSSSDTFDAATSILVSQFISEKTSRIDFFKQIAKRLKANGILISSDLSAKLDSPEYQSLLNVWLEMMREGGIPQEGLDGMPNAYEKDVSVLPPGDIEAIITSGGFERIIQFSQTGLIHSWYCIKG